MRGGLCAADGSRRGGTCQGRLGPPSGSGVGWIWGQSHQQLRPGPGPSLGESLPALGLFPHLYMGRGQWYLATSRGIPDKWVVACRWCQQDGAWGAGGGTMETSLTCVLSWEALT